MKKVGLIFAMKREWDSFFADTAYEGTDFVKGRTWNDTPFVAIVSGVGKVNSAVTAYKLCKEHDCNHIISFGCASGSNYDVCIGDVIVGDEYMYYDVSCGAPNAVGQVQGYPEVYLSDYAEWRFLQGLRHGLIATGDTYVESEIMASSITQLLYPAHSPLALDMESAAIAQVCCNANVGFTSVRVISDNPMSGKRTYNEFWKEKDKKLLEISRKFIQIE